jgi:hypothetical protein
VTREYVKRLWHCWATHFMGTIADCYDESGKWLGAICDCGARFGDKTLIPPSQKKEK